jgi:hypothetical protein
VRTVRVVGLLLGVLAGLSLVAFAAYMAYVVRLWKRAMEA